MKNFTKPAHLCLIAILMTVVSPQKVLASGSETKPTPKLIEKATKNRKAIEKKQLQALKNILEKNEKLHAAFFDYDASKAVSEANALSELVAGMPEGEIKKLLSFSGKKLREIKTEQPREANNKLYHMFSTALIHIINTYQVPGNYNAYYCPMVKLNWVQNSKLSSKIQNPYAPEMKMCGEQKTYF